MAIINGRYKKVGKIGDGSYGDVFKCIDYFHNSKPRQLPQEIVDLIKAVENGDVSTNTNEFEQSFINLFKENDKFLNKDDKPEEPEEGKENFVAIKKTKMRKIDYLKHSFNFSTYKEIVHMQEFDHENIVKLIDIFYKDKNIYVVMEYMVGDLYQVVHKDN